MIDQSSQPTPQESSKQTSQQSSQQGAADQGLGATARDLIQNIFALIAARLSLAALELSEARDAALLVIALALGGFMAASFAVIALSALLVVLTWDALGWRILLILTLAYAAIAAVLVRQIRRIIYDGRLGLPATVAELKQDSEVLIRKTRTGSSHDAR
jgi:uncharacterized membrane protein YqjE